MSRFPLPSLLNLSHLGPNETQKYLCSFWLDREPSLRFQQIQPSYMVVGCRCLCNPSSRRGCKVFSGIWGESSASPISSRTTTDTYSSKFLSFWKRAQFRRFQWFPQGLSEGCIEKTPYELPWVSWIRHSERPDVALHLLPTALSKRFWAPLACQPERVEFSTQCRQTMRKTFSFKARFLAIVSLVWTVSRKKSWHEVISCSSDSLELKWTRKPFAHSR